MQQNTEMVPCYKSRALTDMRIHLTVKRAKILWAWCGPKRGSACGYEKWYAQQTALWGEVTLQNECVTIPCLYWHGSFYSSIGMLVWAGSCLLWYASCHDQEKFIFLAKHQWFFSYHCSCLDARRLSTFSLKQNSTASLLLLCSCFHCIVFWPG